LITGGAGFIGSALVRQLVLEKDCRVVNVDKLTYAGNLTTVAACEQSEKYHFEKVDICNAAEMDRLMAQYRPTRIMHLAAESHVDRSIDGPGLFIETNVTGTYTLLEAARKHFSSLKEKERSAFRFHHVSTDEVYGSLDETGYFTEETPYKPNSPYSASKAASDHLVRAWHKTYGMPTVISNCSNNYGPYQYPEKLIPLMIQKAISGGDLPIYGKGENVRDWLYVDDHARALMTIVEQGVVGETYNVGGRSEMSNIDLVRLLCDLLDELAPRSDGLSYREQISFVADRPGHDLRYAIDSTKIESELGWAPAESLDSGLRKTVEWYLANQEWCREAMKQYQGQRLGMVGSA